MEWSDVSDVFGSALGLATQVITYIVGNPILVVLFAASLIPIGFGIFRGMKRTAL